jgi:hypothetical protein
VLAAPCAGGGYETAAVAVEPVGLLFGWQAVNIPSAAISRINAMYCRKIFIPPPLHFNPAKVPYGKIFFTPL